jgi:NADH:ubiquinone oxidoreductase subunit D
MEFFERVSGARMHTALYRPFTVGSSAFSLFQYNDLVLVLQRGLRIISGAFLGLLSNRAFRSRCSHIGAFSIAKVRSYGITGIIARASGISLDARLGIGANQYSTYAAVTLRTFTGKRGDSFDRFVLRIREVVESYHIILQCLSTMRDSNFMLPNSQFSSLFSRSKFISMESVISHFKNSSSGITLNSGLSLSCVESPKGFVGVFLVSSGCISPYRLHVRSPVAHNLHLLSTVSNGQTFADFVATFCSLDVVLGEIDR